MGYTCSNGYSLVGKECVLTWKDEVYEENIISILTHEQYEENCYKVGDVN